MLQGFLDNDIRNNKIKEGYLIKRSRILRDWKKRWMVLTRTHLYSFEHQQVYRNPTEKIPLKDVSTIKSFYKNQYQRPQVFRIQSEDTYFYLAAGDHQDKWAWMTAIEKMTEATRHPTPIDTQSSIRQTLRQSTALRQTRMSRSSVKHANSDNSGIPANFMKQLTLNLHSGVLAEKISKMAQIKMPVPRVPLGIWKGEAVCVVGEGAGGGGGDERVVEKIVKVPVEVEVEKIVEKIVEVEKIVMVKDNQGSNTNDGGFKDLFTALINSRLQDPKPLLDFVAFLGLSGVERYATVAVDFCCDPLCHRFFGQLMLQVLNDESNEDRLNRYTAFIYILSERDMDYFYSSDLRILIEIVVRELQMYRSDLNQLINLQLLMAMVTYHRDAIGHKAYEIRAIANQITLHGTLQNRQLAQEICMFIQ